jgi:hypothetical protein
MKKSSMKKSFSVAVSGLWLALTFSPIAFGVQGPRAKTLDSTPTPSPISQEAKSKDPDAALTLTAFNYQGQLKDADGPVTGAFDFQFVLYSAQTGGERLGTSEMKDIALTNGLFNLKLDFGRAAVEAKESWLEIGVRQSGSAESYTVLFPRQKLTPTPYAIFAQHEQWSLIGVPVGFADRAVIQEGANIVANPDGATKLKDDEPPKATDQAAAAPQGTANFVAKFDGAGNPTANSIMFDNGANVGIGTTTPSSLLHLRRDVPAGLGPTLTLFNGGGNGGAANSIDFFTYSSPTPTGPTAQIKSIDDGVFSNHLTFSTRLPGSNGNALMERMRITSNGNVGLGTPTPAARLHVVGNWDGGIPALRLSGEKPTIQFIGDAVSSNVQWNLHLGSNGPGNLEFYDTRSPIPILALRPLGHPELSQVLINAQNGLETVGYQPFLTLNDSNNNAYRRIRIQDVNGDINFQTHSATLNPAGGSAMYIRDSDGLVSVKILQIQGGSDLSENFDVRGSDRLSGDVSPAEVRPGLVVAIDPENYGKLVVSHQAYDPRVAGVVSGAGGVKPGMVMGHEGTVANGKYPVALSGRVYCWADASYGPIQPGDLLTTSATPGYAMKVKNHKKAQGAIIGKAMTELKAGQGLVLVLVTLQ